MDVEHTGCWGGVDVRSFLLCARAMEKRGHDKSVTTMGIDVDRTCCFGSGHQKLPSCAEAMETWT